MLVESGTARDTDLVGEDIPRTLKIGACARVAFGNILPFRANNDVQRLKLATWEQCVAFLSLSAVSLTSVGCVRIDCRE